MVISSIRDKASISYTLGSDLAHVHRVVRQSEDFARQWGVDDYMSISIVMKELLENAIVHGNGNIPSRTVKCHLERTCDGHFRIVVEDEGNGFDFASLDTSLPDDPRNIRNRGYVLIRSICNALEFNERGNQVTALIHASENSRVA